MRGGLQSLSFQFKEVILKNRGDQINPPNANGGGKSLSFQFKEVILKTSVGIFTGRIIESGVSVLSIQGSNSKDLVIPKEKLKEEIKSLSFQFKEVILKVAELVNEQKNAGTVSVLSIQGSNSKEVMQLAASEIGRKVSVLSIQGSNSKELIDRRNFC